MGNLTAKQAKFVESYRSSGDLKQAVVEAGYCPKNANSLAVQANRMLKNAKVVSEIANWKQKKASEITKPDYIDRALQSFESLDITEPNAPRFFEIAGKALGYVGVANDQRTSTINNNLQINLNGTESHADLWSMARKLIGND